MGRPAAGRDFAGSAENKYGLPERGATANVGRNLVLMITLILDGRDRQQQTVLLEVDGTVKDTLTGSGDLLTLVAAILKANKLSIGAVSGLIVREDGGSLTGIRLAKAIAEALIYSQKLNG